jgi:hypothetical protein
MSDPTDGGTDHRPPPLAPPSAPDLRDQWPPPPPQSGHPAPPPASPAAPPPGSPAYAPPAAPGYAPPPSGYAPPPPGYGPSPSGYAPPAPGYAPPGPPFIPAPPGRRGARPWWFVAAAVVVVAAVVGGVVVVRGGGDDDTAYAFGQVGEATGGAIVRTAADEESRPLEAGETVLAGWVVEAAGDAAVTIELAGGGVVRFEGGAELTFADLARDPDTGKTSGRSDPKIEIAGGRTWVNPAGEPSSAAIEVQVPEAVVASEGNPVAVDCTATCQVEAPAGGVTLTTSGGQEAAPAPNEIVTVEGADSLDLSTEPGPSDWARTNMDADAAADMPAPETVDSPGIKGAAVLDGTYIVTLDVTGASSGDAIPSELQYNQGEAYTVNLVVDGSGCAAVPCDVTLTADDTATGTAHVENASITLSFSQPIDCYDETFTEVVDPGIGTTTVETTLQVTEARQDGDRWRVSSFDGTGTVAATLSTPCNPGETLGTATSPISLSGSG